MRSLLALVSIIIFLSILLGVLLISYNYRDRFKSPNDQVNKKKYLLFSSVGKRDSDVRAVDMWYDNRRNRDYDIVLYYYSTEPPSDCEDHCLYKPGFKFENFYDYAINNDISEYESIFIVDDDIEISANQLNELFELFVHHDLDIAQPAFTHDSHISHPITVQDKGCILRYCNFIENGVMMVSSKALKKCLEVFKNASTGWGLDYIVCSLVDNGSNIAIIDKVTCRHPYSESTLDNIVSRSQHGVLGRELLKSHCVEVYEPKEYRRIEV